MPAGPKIVLVPLVIYVCLFALEGIMSFIHVVLEECTC